MALFSNDPEWLYEEADQQDLGKVVMWFKLSAYLDLNASAMNVRLNSGQVEEAKLLAERILLAEDHYLSELFFDHRPEYYPFAYARAHWVLGNKAEAWRYMTNSSDEA